MYQFKFSFENFNKMYYFSANTVKTKIYLYKTVYFAAGLCHACHKLAASLLKASLA